MKYHIITNKNQEEFLQDLEIFMTENKIWDSEPKFYYSSADKHFSVLLMWR
jgi:hypothetical protein